jgi:FAD:protein FMN transferase
MIGADPLVRTRRRSRGAAPSPMAALVSVATTTMGGRLAVHLAAAADDQRARRDANRVLARVDRWASRLSRHIVTSELSTLNADPRPSVTVRQTLAAALRAGMDAGELSHGFVDITLLDARLAAEGLLPASRTGRASSSWSLTFGQRGTAAVRRPSGVRFDLGGVAKGWLADRALDLLTWWPTALIDADGDLAVRCAPGHFWTVAIDDPRADEASLALLHLSAPDGRCPTRWGVATSGTSIHRWRRADEIRHHLIDPRTGAPAVTDVVQATVVCGSALRAEAFAKAAVISGSVEGLALLERAGVEGAVILTDRGETLALPSTLVLLDAPRESRHVRDARRG